MIDISRACGSDTTAISIKRALDRHITPHVKRIHAALEKGEDPKGLSIGVDGPATKGQSLSSRYLAQFYDLGAAMQTAHMLMFLQRFRNTLAAIRLLLESDSIITAVSSQMSTSCSKLDKMALTARKFNSVVMPRVRQHVLLIA